MEAMMAQAKPAKANSLRAKVRIQNRMAKLSRATIAITNPRGAVMSLTVAPSEFPMGMLAVAVAGGPVLDAAGDTLLPAPVDLV